MSDRYDRTTLERWDDAHIWHPFTPHSVYRADEPLIIVEGDGNYLIDVDGHRYLDGVGSLWCNIFGHRHPRLDAALRAQLDRIAHSTLLGHSGQTPILLARRLAQLAPEGLERVFFSDNGSTAVEVAVKMALQYWQQVGEQRDTKRTRFLALGQGYHGDTIGAVSVGGISLFHARFAPMLFDVEHVPSPFSFREQAQGDPEKWLQLAAENMEEALERSAGELAAVVIEPGLQGASGMLSQPPGYLKCVRELTRKYGTLMVVDEVAMGMGRSGYLFACEREGIVPDFLCLAKGLTGGYLPVAATLTHGRIFEAFLGPPQQGRTFFHGHTYTGNALGSATALAVLDIFEEPGFFAALRDRIARFEAGLDALKDLPYVADVRHYGLAAGIELMKDPVRSIPFDASERRGMAVCRAARDMGVFLRPLGDVVVLMPPLTLSEQEMDLLFDAVAHGIRVALSDE